MSSRRRELEDLLRTTRPQPPADLEQRLAGAVPRLTRPTRVGRLRGAVAVALVILVAVAAGTLGAFSRTADAGDRTIGVVQGALEAPGAVAADSTTARVAAADRPTPGAPLAPPVADGSAAALSSDEAGVADRESSSAATGAPATVADDNVAGLGSLSRSLASIGTYSIGDWICHWTVQGQGNGVYNNNRLLTSSWQPVQLTSPAIVATHVGEIRDYGPAGVSQVPGGPSAASCASGSPPA